MLQDNYCVEGTITEEKRKERIGRKEE